MIGHIYIYGEIANWQDKNSNEYGITSLSSVSNGLKMNEEADEIHVHIHSVGGEVNEGLAIYDLLKSSNKKITTINEGMCASISSVIYLAGEERQATPNSQFLIHNAWTFAVGDADEMEKTSEGLRKYNNIINDIYSKETKLSKEEIKTLMDYETEFTAKQGVTNGFVTKEIEQLKAVAKINTNNMNLDKIKEVFGLGKEIKNEVKAVVLTLKDGTSIDSSSTEAIPMAKDTWTIDGKLAESGSYELQSGFNCKIENGKVTEVEKVTEEIKDTAEVVAMKKENEEFKAIIKSNAEKIEGLEKSNDEKIELMTEMTETFKALKNSTSKEINTESKQFEETKVETGVRTRLNLTEKGKKLLEGN